ncbi:DUF4406 domain-containing protein [Brachyspira hyodysenteriae]|uniref:DUF4406 domain-containing protein n=1 Tax=Brachyspira hyodysenteriae TaxID=159 RepID=UPI0022CD44E8|nr:DUF4406 domain-containing protein [Brachyspira hyodysenteriae]MCZ9850208.1 DUF4406 domain-containing protein [Brachyspira hyodysenteriae]MCZ9878178.1 DUF4406 domain-containing protein [Brachyspira hyodysenteriae]MCZ9894626.1 DUF4406 domain-containing protein [Brachyspira hyodysenteriae]MCZ9898329.1 DUF4406 domain-containing protein [Brachyspira hyodysenteriae]MCZ9951851.1 DUF4406 domain-containing protein [Brachyspira hyodysenteriae]
MEMECEVCHKTENVKNHVYHIGKLIRVVFVCDECKSNVENIKHLFNTKYKQTKIYLSGAITGRENYKQEFYEAKKKLIKFQEDNNKRKDTERIDLDIIVPCDYGYLNKTGRWEDYLKNDIKLLVDCDCLIDIENESCNSKGALLEKMICTALEIPIISLSSFLSYKATYKYSTTNLEMKQ